MSSMLVPNWSLMDVSLTIPDSAIGPEWRDLARRALTPSGYNAPELLLPALQHVKGANLATARDSEGLQLVMPLQTRSLPLKFHRTVTTPLSFYGMPHLGPYVAVPALMALLRQLKAPLLLHSVPEDSATWDVISAAAGHLAVIARWERAVLRPAGNYEEWFEANFDRKRRKEYRRLQARLAEAGRLETKTFSDDDDIAAWTEEFLSLEASGWKGRRGTALQGTSGASGALHEGLAGLASSNKLRFWKLALDGRPIAMLFAIVDRRHAWLGKIAHDESFARFSPGVLLILHATQQLFAESIIEADSCAIPNHPMIDRIWRQRLKVADVMIAPADYGRMGFVIAAETERLRRNIRSTAKTIYCRLTGNQRS